MRRLLSAALVLALAPALAAQPTTFSFESAAEVQEGDYWLVQDSTAGVGLIVHGGETDWHARDVSGFGGTVGRAAYPTVGTNVVTLRFSTPVRVVGVRAATIMGTQTWTFRDAEGHTETVEVDSKGRRLTLGLPATTRLTIESSAGTFFPVFDDLEVEAAAQTSTHVAADASSGVSLAVYPQPAGETSRVHLSGLVGAARVTVFDVLGRAVAVLHDGPAPPALSLDLDARALAAGTYVVVVEHAAGRATHPLVVAR